MSKYTKQAITARLYFATFAIFSSRLIARFPVALCQMSNGVGLISRGRLTVNKCRVFEFKRRQGAETRAQLQSTVSPCYLLMPAHILLLPMVSIYIPIESGKRRTSHVSLPLLLQPFIHAVSKPVPCSLLAPKRFFSLAPAFRVAYIKPSVASIGFMYATRKAGAMEKQRLGAKREQGTGEDIAWMKG